MKYKRLFKSFFYFQTYNSLRGWKMEKNNDESYNHIINITDRKAISLSGIKKINNFDNTEFFVDSIMGPLIIKGEGLELLKMDTFQGNLTIKGRITLINYLEDNKKFKADNIMARLFKWLILKNK